MYDTRWPRPGPAMLAVAVLFGLVIGGVFGFTSGTSAGAGSGNGDVPGTTAAPVPSTLPASFHTAVVASGNQRAPLESRRVELRQRGVPELQVIAQSQFPDLQRNYALISGVFTTEAAARQRVARLRDAGLQPYYRFIKG
jgi:cell division septation protein DedD